MPRLYLDTCVLISAWKGRENPGESLAWAELNRDDATFLYSRIVELELVSKATNQKSYAEVAFYYEYFADAELVDFTNHAFHCAVGDACRLDMGAMDAAHVAAALAGGADELVTFEKPTKPLPRASCVPVRSLWSVDV